MSTNKKPVSEKEIDTYDDSFDTALSASKKDVHLGNMTLVNTVCKTDRFVSYHTATVAKAEQICRKTGSLTFKTFLVTLGFIWF